MQQGPSELQTLLVFAIVWAAMIASGIWEAYVEGRNPWDKGKLGWKIKIGSFVLTGYHFFLFWIMYPLFLALPFVFTGWNAELLGILISAYATGIIIEDFTWYVANPVVRFGEWFTEFSDYYPWIKVGGRKIIPTGYVVGVLVAIGSWYFLWR
jgi:hypothetical protein